MARRPLVILVVFAVVGVAVALLARRSPAPPKAPAVVAVGPTAPPIAEDEGGGEHPHRAPERTVVRTQTYFEPVDEAKLTSEQAAAAAARYRRAARFPRTSRPLEDGLDPIARSRAPKVDFDDDKHPEPHLLVYPSLTGFESPSEVVIYAEVMEVQMASAHDERRPERQRAQQLRTGARSVRGVLQTMDGVVVAPLAFYDDGTHGDAQPEDDLFTATYTPDPDRPNDFRGQYQVVAQAESLKGDTLTASTSFVYSVQIAHLTGRYRDSIVDGNLQVEGEVEVDEPGRFRLEGTLVTTADAKMLGYAYADADLDAGTHWIPLVYYGLIFHDMKAPGPYSLFSVMLSTLGGDVAQESDVVPNAHTTKKYAIDDFGSAPFNDPEYMAKAQHYDDIARAKKAQ